MPFFIVIILLAALFLPSRQGHASPPQIDISADDLQMLQTRAAQGNTEAQTTLGHLYNNGQGVPQDYTKAAQWYEKAAALGNMKAQYHLGALYENGRGVPQDYTKARQWYERAAAQGGAGAQFQLGGLYFGAKGVPKDNVRTYMWWSLASAHSTGDLSKLAADNRERIAQRMTPAQIAEAKRLAQQCQSQQLKGC